MPSKCCEVVKAIVSDRKGGVKRVKTKSVASCFQRSSPRKTVLRAEANKHFWGQIGGYRFAFVAKVRCWWDCRQGKSERRLLFFKFNMFHENARVSCLFYFRRIHWLFPSNTVYFPRLLSISLEYHKNRSKIVYFLRLPKMTKNVYFPLFANTETRVCWSQGHVTDTDRRRHTESWRFCTIPIPKRNRFVN